MQLLSPLFSLAGVVLPPPQFLLGHRHSSSRAPPSSTDGSNGPSSSAHHVSAPGALYVENGVGLDSFLRGSSTLTTDLVQHLMYLVSSKNAPLATSTLTKANFAGQHLLELLNSKFVPPVNWSPLQSTLMVILHPATPLSFFLKLNRLSILGLLIIWFLNYLVLLISLLLQILVLLNNLLVKLFLLHNQGPFI